MDFVELKRITLKSIFKQYKFRISFTLFLVVTENVLYLLFPLVLGYAINGLIEGSLFWLIGLTILGLGDVFVSAIRRFYDTRLYGKIFADLTPHMVEKQFNQTDKVSKVSARVDMLEEMIDFFEDMIPEIIGTLISLFGTLFILFYLDLQVFTLSLITWFLVMVIYKISTRRTKTLHAQLNDTKENQIEIIRQNQKEKTYKFTKKLMRCYVNLSDLEMVNFALSFALLIFLISTSLYLVVSGGLTEAGAVFSIIIYLFNFLDDVIQLPMFYQNYIRLTEIMHRLK